ncbi:MAG TPA: TatD family hydrolase [Patescibacteria group bacterium]
MLVDTHAHLNFAAFKDDFAETIKRSLDSDTWMINVGSQFSTSQKAVEIASQYAEGVYAAIGLHPIHLETQVRKEKIDEKEEFEFTSREEIFNPENYKKLAENPKVVAVGECGLDYFHDKNNKEKQKAVFRQQIKLAAELDLPLIVHCREANADVIEILQEAKKTYKEKLRGVIHCFSGGLPEAREYITLDFFLGFNGIITFARDYDKVLLEIGLEHAVVETDCPYLTPPPHRGKRNEPAYVKHVAEKIAQLKGITVAEVGKITTENAKKLFNL